MRWNLTKPNYSPIGIDFGTDSVKMLQIEQGDEPRMVAAAARVLPHDIRNNTEERRKFLAQAIPELYKEGGFSGKRVIASIPTPLTFIQHVRIARVEPGQMMSAVGDALRDRLPVDPSQLVMRCVEVGEVMVGGVAKQEVICMAAARQAVMHHVDIINRAKLTVAGIHSEPIAIVEAFAHLYRRAGDDQKTTLFVDMGSVTTKAIIAHGRQIAFAKAIQVGAEHFDRQYARELQIELHEARARRRRLAGIALPAEKPVTVRATQHVAHGPSSSQATGRGDESSRQVAADAGQPLHETLAAGGEMLECLIDELQLCIGYHGSIFQRRPIDMIVFVGGESSQTAMCQRVARTLKIPAQLGDPMARFGRTRTTKPPVGVDFRKSQPAWAVPLGLCRLPGNL